MLNRYSKEKRSLITVTDNLVERLIWFEKKKVISTFLFSAFSAVILFQTRNVSIENSTESETNFFDASLGH